MRLARQAPFRASDAEEFHRYGHDAEPQSFEAAHELHSDAHAPLWSPPPRTLRFAGAARGMGAP